MGSIFWMGLSGFFTVGEMGLNVGFRDLVFGGDWQLCLSISIFEKKRRKRTRSINVFVFLLEEKKKKTSKNILIQNKKYQKNLFFLFYPLCLTSK